MKTLSGARGNAAIAVGLLCALVRPVAADAAERTSLFSRYDFQLEAGAFLTDFDTSLALRGPEGGSDVALEDVLQLDERDTAFRGQLDWRFADRHALSLGYYSFERSEVAAIEESFTVDTEDQTLEFEGAAIVRSRFDWALLPVTYAYSFLLRERLEATASIGLHWATTKVALEGEAFVDGSSVARAASEAESLSAPLPVFGTSVNYAFTPRWFLGARLQYFGLEFDDYAGDLVDLRVQTTYWFAERFGAGLGYNWYDIDFEQDDGVHRFEFEYRYEGFEAFLKYRF